MKTIKFLSAIFAVTVLSIYGCQREMNDFKSSKSINETNAKAPAPLATCNSNAYTITLESKVLASGNWTWTWSIMNPNPGNGTNGTSQDMSHWGMQFSECFDWSHVVSAAYSYDNSNWVSFIPSYNVDPSQTCVSTPVLKYNIGTNAMAKTYYQLVLSQNYDVNSTASGYYKSGARMPCCTFDFNGVGCLHVDEGCSLSQGYWFSNSMHVWPDVNGVIYGNETIGGFHYAEAEGRAIGNTSNSGGLKDAKKAFMQVTAIKLSGATVHLSASVWADVAICEAWLSGLGKLTPTNIPTGNQAVKEAAGRIGNWIMNHHCE